jgi:hypothetical protein
VLTFALRAHDGQLLSPASRVDVTVTPFDGSSDGGGGCRAGRRPPRPEGAAALAGLALALLVARRSRSGPRARAGA